MEDAIEKSCWRCRWGVVYLRQPGQENKRDKRIRHYADFLKGTVSGDFEGMKVAVDCANGAAFKVAPLVLEELEQR